MAYGWRAFERPPGLAMLCRQPQASSPDLQVAVTGRSATNSESHGGSWANSLAFKSNSNSCFTASDAVK